MLLVYVLCFNSNQLNSVASCHQLFSATPSNSSKLITWLRCAVYQEIQTVFVLQFGSLEYGITCCNKQNIQVLWSQCDILNNKVNKRDWFNSLFYDGIDTTHVNTFKNIFTGILRTKILLTLHKIVTFLLWSSSKWLWLKYSSCRTMLHQIHFKISFASKIKITFILLFTAGRKQNNLMAAHHCYQLRWIHTFQLHLNTY